MIFASPAAESFVNRYAGPMVGAAILRAVPNIPVFRMALRAIKLWAKGDTFLLSLFGCSG
jgi:poly(A) polymerase Pap1